MKFLVDARLPRQMKEWLTVAGCDAVHTLDLPDGNRTTDEQIVDAANREVRVLVTKDAGFVDSHLLRGRPAKLLVVSTGNIHNRDLEALVVPAIPDIVREFETQAFLELGRAGIVIRGYDVVPEAEQTVCSGAVQRSVIGWKVNSRRPLNRNVRRLTFTLPARRGGIRSGVLAVPAVPTFAATRAG